MASASSPCAVVHARHNDAVVFDVESVSIGGARLVGAMTVGRGESIDVVFDVDGSAVDVRAEVLSVEPVSAMLDRIAIRFVDLPERARRLLHVLVARTFDLGRPT